MTVLATTTFVPAVLFSVDKRFSLPVSCQNHFMAVPPKCLGQTFGFAEGPTGPGANHHKGVRRQFLQERVQWIATEIDVAL
jgi:hypothetical protein